MYNTNYTLNKNIKAGLFLILPFFILYGIPAFWKHSTHVYPILFISIISVGTAFIIKIKSHRFLKSSACYAILVLLSGFFGMPNWLNYISDKSTDTNFIFPEIDIVDINEKAFRFEKGKTYVLDLWSLACAPCIDKFPDFEELHLKYINQPDVEFYSLCLPIKGRNYNHEITKRYSFNKLYTLNVNSWEELGVKEIPKYIVINSNSEVVYIGRLNDKWYHFYNNINQIIRNEKNKTKEPFAITD